MLPELGRFAICLALSFACLQALSKQFCMRAAWGQFIFLAFSMLCLITSFLVNDMTVIYVREHSHHLLPFFYRVGAAWGGHEGSLLLWCLILSGWTALFILANVFFPRITSIHNNLLYKMIRILGLMNASFIAFLLFTSDPFRRSFPTTPVVGDDLTPILQDPGLIFHPPTLYLGYVGFAIAFAFAIAVLIEGRLDKTSAKACRPWVILPWSFLSCGIVLGSWWAYRELGWGGWWFWDPVENASLLPWLAATALIHSLIVSEKRGAFQGWTILLAIITFALCLLGTFLVRSGVIVSVHAFANDPERGVFLLMLLAFMIGSALIYYIFRIKHFYHPPHFKLLSRETFLLSNTVILVTAVATILIGTFYPIILDALNFEKISVGEPYFNSVFIPIMVPLLILMGVAPLVNWEKQALYPLWKKIRFSILTSFLLAFILPWIFNYPWQIFSYIGIVAGIWIIVATGQYVVTLLRLQKKIALRHGSMIIAHLGIAICVLGITVNKSYSTERQVKMKVGESVTIMNYHFTFKHILKSQSSNYNNIIASFSVQQNTQHSILLSAEQRIYMSHEQVMSKAGILFNMWRDVYIVLGNPLPNDVWSVRIYYKPFVRWIWFGGFMLLLSGVLSILNYILNKGRE